MSGFSSVELGALAFAVFSGGVVDAMAGGGGLITLPAYIAAGLDPALVLGTNKLGSAIGTVAATGSYMRKLRFKPAGAGWIVAAALLGSVAGARLALLLDPRWMRWLLLAAIPVLGTFILSQKRLGAEDSSHRHHPRALLGRTLAVTAPIAAYDGFFGPGTGTFFALALTRLCGYDLLKATALSKLLNLSSNIAALAAFLWAGRVDVPLGLAMAAASIGGNTVGSAIGLKRGARVIRPVMLVVLAGLFLKLLAK